MPSKGVDYYFYVSTPNHSITATECNNTYEGTSWQHTFAAAPGFQTGNVQVNWSFGTYDFHTKDGSFSWVANTVPPAIGNIIINPITGNNNGGSLANLMATPSIIGQDFACSYGFYDSGPGVDGLTNQDQAYAYLTPPMLDWMGQLVQNYPAAGTQPFARFCLPGAHDSGTFDLTMMKKLLSIVDAVGVVTALMGNVAFGCVIDIAASQVLQGVTNLAVTQKDTISRQLALGCRFFDFRPGYVAPQLQSFVSGIYHQHTVIPGYPFQSFLEDVISFLVANPTEIVVVGANDQGFYSPAMIPTAAVLEGVLDTACQAVTAQLKPPADTPALRFGGAADLQTSYNDLVTAGKRLIFLNFFANSDSDPAAGWSPAQKYDSYFHGNYATTNPANITAALGQMNQAGQAGCDFTVLQLQGTTEGLGKEEEASAALSQSQSSSPMMSTKPAFDSTTYPWLLANVNKNLGNDQLVVFLNDFVDNALAQVAMTVTRQRMGLAG